MDREQIAKDIQKIIDFRVYEPSLVEGLSYFIADYIADYVEAEIAKARVEVAEEILQAWEDREHNYGIYGIFHTKCKEIIDKNKE